MSISIRLKLLGAFFIIALFVVGISYLNILQQNQLVKSGVRTQHSYARTQALLQMKNTASELDAEIISLLSSVEKNTAQAEGTPASDKKYKILASLDLLTKWKDEYQTNLDDTTQTKVSFVYQIDVLKNAIIDNSLEYINLREQGIQTDLAVNKYQALALSVATLKSEIDAAIDDELLTIQTSIDVADTSKKQADIISYIVSFTSFLVAIFLGVYLNKRIVGPVRKIRDAVLRIAKGDLEQSINIRTHDELGDLSSTFNAMTIKLKESRTALETQVKENTDKSAALSKQVVQTERSKAAIINLLEDIDAEKKKVELIVIERTNELRGEKARLLASINSLSFGFIIADMKHNIFLKNKAMADLLGPTNETNVNSVADISRILGEDFDVQAQIEKCLKGNVICEIKGIIFEKKFLRGVVAPITVVDEKNEMIGYVFLLEDIESAPKDTLSELFHKQ